MKFGNEFWLILFQEYISPKLFAVYLVCVTVNEIAILRSFFFKHGSKKTKLYPKPRPVPLLYLVQSQEGSPYDIAKNVIPKRKIIRWFLEFPFSLCSFKIREMKEVRVDWLVTHRLKVHITYVQYFCIYSIKNNSLYISKSHLLYLFTFIQYITHGRNTDKA